MDSFVVGFFYDIIVYSPSQEEHAQHFYIVLQILWDPKLYAKFFKYELCLESMTFLSNMVSS